MGVVTNTGAWPQHGRPFTVGDLERMPDDGHRYELLDGTLIVSPAPSPAHQRVSVMLTHVLEGACPQEFIVLADVSVRLGAGSAVEPDVVVALPSDVSGACLVRPPLLVAEILSPDSALRDLNLKKAAYERFGVPSYWVIDPDLERLSLLAFELADGVYSEVGCVTGSTPFGANRPFPVEVTPGDLIGKLRRQG